MTRVCQDWFPNENPDKTGFYMEEDLKSNLDILIKNIIDDWDFTLIVSGGGEVRVGKSVLAMQVACYLSYMMEKVHNKKVMFELNKNFVFSGQELIKRGNHLGQNHQYSCLIYDEAGSDLQGKKIMLSATQDVLDYFRECGQYNLFNILVIPDFFDLPRPIALTRSIALIDVYYDSDENGKFERGSFNFYSKRQKKWLWLKGKKDMNYFAASYDFHGKFFPFYTVDEKKYRKLKKESLIKRENRRRDKTLLQRNACYFLLNKEFGMSQETISKRLENLTGYYLDRSTISDAIIGIELKKEEIEDKKNEK